MRLFCWFAHCRWIYLGAFEQADPTVGPTGTQGSRGLYQCTRCKTVSIGAPIDPALRYDVGAHALRYP